MAEKFMISFQSSPKQNEKLQKTMELRGLSRSAIIKEGIWLITGMDPFTLSVAEEFALSISAPLAVVFETAFLRWIAERDAHRTVYGKQPEFGLEFTKDGQQFIKGQRLYQNMRANYEHGFLQTRKEQLRKKIDALEPLLTDADLPDDRQETYRAMHAELQRELDTLTSIQPKIDPDELKKHLTDQRDYIQKYIENDSEGDD